MVTDPVGDFITQIINASRVGHASVSVPYSKLKHEIGGVLAKEGFVKGVTKKGKKIKKLLEVELKYDDETPKVKAVKRISKPGMRIYKGSNEIKLGKGSLIISTPKGIMSGVRAKKEKIGGEVMFSIE